MPEDPRLKKLRELRQELATTGFVTRGRALTETLSKESDCGCAIIGASLLEDRLEALLRAICCSDEESIKQAVDPLFESYAPFATFSAKVQAAFAFRLISRELKSQLDLIRRIRNDFAHDQGPLSFQTGQCHDRLRALIESHAQHFGLNSTILEDVSGRSVFALVVGDIFGQLEYIRIKVTAGFYP
jgi:DNA-binding MltR family transcriptional regulator